MLYVCNKCHKLGLYSVCSSCAGRLAPISFKNVSYISIMQSRGCWTEDIFNFIRTKRVDEIARLFFDNPTIDEQNIARNIQMEVTNHTYTVNRDEKAERSLMHHSAKPKKLSPFDIQRRKFEKGELVSFKFKRQPTLFDDSEVIYALYLARVSADLANCQVVKMSPSTKQQAVAFRQVQVPRHLDKKYLKGILLDCDEETILSIDNLKSVT